ncbi:alginate export family protein [Flavobacterium zhairuonense]|uniref:alginate export family protein n=1 Tax=Flavobacterium zhairuonense TaxID=2493631 RepID=UPI00104C6D72|nr:alginate export family protein [Flavobacterium zhairuonense]KAF2514756.1 alginate export family protein [Flavobacterium zhairuonense]
MKKIILLLLIYINLHAQSYPDFKPLRFDENYEVLQKDTVKKNWYKTMKYMPLSSSGQTYLSFGGEVRYQYFYAKNEKWGDDPQDPDGYILNRFLLHADFHSSKYFRAFVQLQSSNANGRIDPSPVDSNPLEVHQGFIDINLFSERNKQLIFRAGRQELSYGSQRLVAVRDGPNNRQSFDAAKAIFGYNNYHADLFYSHYVVAQDGIFDDYSNKKRQFWGSYFVINKIPAIKNIDLYYLGYERANANFDDASGKELRHSVGTRIWGKYKEWRYDAEAVYQFGDVASKDIKAWTVSLNTGYRLSTVVLKPEFGIKVELISGDKTNGDTKLNTFNPLFPRGAYFGLASVIGPSNLVDFHPSISLELAKNIDWVVDYDMFWRYSSEDGIYGPNTIMIYPGDATDAKEIGKQLESEIIYTPNQYLYFRVEATWFKAGDFLKAAGTGKNMFFTGVTMQLKF